jgi:hypothetical protein
MSDAPRDLYVSSVDGHLVSRPGSSVLIGATRDIREPTKVTWDTHHVVKIPEAEVQAYRREYDRALRDKSLQRRDKAEFDAQVKREEAQAEKEAAERAKAEADAKAKADAEAKKSGKKE